MLFLEARPQSLLIHLFVLFKSRVLSRRLVRTEVHAVSRCRAAMCLSPQGNSNVSLASRETNPLGGKFCLETNMPWGQISMCFLPAARRCLWLLVKAIFEVRIGERFALSPFITWCLNHESNLLQGQILVWDKLHPRKSQLNPIPNQLNIQMPHIPTLWLAQMIQYCDHGSSVGVLCVRS